MEPFALVVDLGGTKIAAARVDSAGKITHRVVAPTPASGGEPVVAAVIDILHQLPQQGVCALGVDVPGLAYTDGSVWAPNLSGWKRMPLGAMLNAHFRLPILVESDRNAFVTGEAWQGAARNCRDVVFLAIGTGIGAGIISGGCLLRGPGELAGCLGWMATGSRYLPRYKEIGCLESHLAGPGIAREASRIRKTATTTRELIQLARQGDPVAKKVIAQTGEYLGLALANLVSILNPEMIVVGGGVAAAGNLLLAPARDTMRQWAQPLAAKQVRIVRSRLGARAALLGMAKMAFDLASR
ncbi:MAG TPA: ROK family protein [Acidobacteriaceae bacterium]|nr:ROK family protein [Acidobacteriaceae bacterium]